MAHSGNFFFAFLALARQFWCSENKTKIRATVLFFAILTLLQNAMALWFTHWSADLFNALEQHSMQGLLTQIGVLGLIFVCDISLTATHLTVKRNLQISWRDWMTDHVFSRWMQDGRHYLISHMPGEHDNPDGRIAEDCRIATESAVVMGHSLFYSVFLLISFTEVLWSLSGVVEVNLGLVQFSLHGHLVWIAIGYTMLASWIGWRVSKPLTAVTNNRQTAEANFRASLIEAHENSQAIALIRADQCEQSHFRSLFRELRRIWNTQTKAWRKIVMFGTGYAALNKAFPVLISSPRYIVGQISLGSLMQAAQSFQHMVSALSWPVDNLGGIAEWRASVERILGLLRAIDNVEEEIRKPVNQWIQLKESDRPVLAFRDLSIAKFEGAVLASHIDMEIHKGERVLITGNTFTGAKLFRAIAGIRPWGSGVIELPSEGRLFFMPPRPHLPSGSLRGAICYPASRRVYTQEHIEAAMRLAGVEHLIEQLDQRDKWSTTLARGEQQRLGMVRLLLNRPQWIFLQEAFDSLDSEDEEKMLHLIADELPESTLLAISHLPNGVSFYSRRLGL